MRKQPEKIQVLTQHHWARNSAEPGYESRSSQLLNCSMVLSLKSCSIIFFFIPEKADDRLGAGGPCKWSFHNTFKCWITMVNTWNLELFLAIVHRCRWCSLPEDAPASWGKPLLLMVSSVENRREQLGEDALWGMCSETCHLLCAPGMPNSSLIDGCALRLYLKNGKMVSGRMKERKQLDPLPSLHWNWPLWCF